MSGARLSRCHYMGLVSMDEISRAIHIMLTLLAHAFLVGAALAVTVFTCPTAA